MSLRNEKRILLILQALRWNLTKAESTELRKRIISEYISNDLLNHEEGFLIIDLLKSTNEHIRMSTSRLINAFASMNLGKNL